MRKEIVKKIFAIGMLFLASALFLWNCQTDETIIVGDQQKVLKVDRHVFPLRHLLVHNNKAYNIIKELQERSSEVISKSGNLYSEEYNLYYSLDEIYIIEGENYQQFSFSVFSANSNQGQFENYVLIEYADASFRQFILTFEYDTPTEESYHFVNIRELEGNSILKSGSSTSGLPQLSPVYVDYCTYTECTGASLGAGGGHSWGDPTCQCNEIPTCQPPGRSCRTEVQWVMTYPSGSTNTGNPNSPNNGQTGGGSTAGGSTSNPSGDNEIVIIPIEDDARLRVFENSLEEEELLWWNDPNNYSTVRELKKHLIENNYSDIALNYVEGSIELELFTCESTAYTTCITLQYNPGKIDGRDEYPYTHIGTDGIRTVFRMTNGDRIIRSNSRLKMNSGDYDFGSEFSDNKYHYIKTVETGDWAQFFLLENSTSLYAELEKLFQVGAQELGQFLGTYVCPVEDIKILITGTDFDGEPASRWLAAGMLLVEIIPGGKVFRLVKDAVGDSWKIVLQIGTKTYVRIVNKLSDEVLAAYNIASNNGASLADQALRSGEYLDDVIEEAVDVLEDEVARRNRKLTWSEIRALWGRGNDFNKKSINEDWYDYHEIHLENGKRLDSYDPFLGEIVSRKATDLDQIQFSTFVNYLSELVTKYANGIKIRSNKYPDIDGQTLNGTYYLEIPDSNQSLPNIQYFIDYAWDNYQVRIRFRPE